MTEQDHLSRLIATFPALKTALAEGRDWESSPDDWQPALPEMAPHQDFIEHFGDPHGFVLARLVRGARIKSGLVYDVFWLVDVDGSLLDADSCDLGNDGYAAWHEDCGPAATVRAWYQYVGEVAKSGNDPLDFLTVPPAQDDVREEWEVLVEEGAESRGFDGVQIVAARKYRTWNWAPLDELPEYVRLELVRGNIGASIKSVDSLDRPAAPGRTVRARQGIVIPDTLYRQTDGKWLLCAEVNREPVALRTRKAAEEWLRSHVRPTPS